MRPIHIAAVNGKKRPVLVLTREIVRDRLNHVTVAPITSRARGLATEVPVGTANGIGHDSVINCDAITSLDVDALGPPIGYLLPAQESTLTEAIKKAFDLDE